MDRIALVTGANRGIGFEIVRQLAKLGLTAVLSAREEGKASAAVRRLAQEGITVGSAVLDVCDDESVVRSVSRIESQYGPIDILVNNAATLIDGPGGFSASVFDLTTDILRRTLATNLEGPLRLIKAVVPGMRRRGYGRVVNISSMAGQIEGMGAGYPAYRLSKAALNALTKIVADEVKEPDVKINAMCPGWVRTDLGGSDAPRSVEEGADTAVWLATLSVNGPTGGLFQDRKPVAW